MVEYLSAGYFPYSFSLSGKTFFFPFITLLSSLSTPIFHPLSLALRIWQSAVWTKEGWRKFYSVVSLGACETSVSRLGVRAWFGIRGQGKECLPLSQISPHLQLFSVVLRYLAVERVGKMGPSCPSLPTDSLRTITRSRVRLEKVPSQVPLVSLGPSKCLCIHHLRPAPPLDKQN